MTAEGLAYRRKRWADLAEGRSPEGAPLLRACGCLHEARARLDQVEDGLADLHEDLGKVRDLLTAREG